MGRLRNIKWLGACSGLLTLLCALVRCGQVADERDAGSDATADTHDSALVQACDETMPFVFITAVSELNTSLNERGLRFTPDELIGVFSRDEMTDAAVDANIFNVIRTARDASLLSPQVALDFSGSNGYPSITASAETLYFEPPNFAGACPDTTVGQSMLCFARRVDGGMYGAAPFYEVPALEGPEGHDYFHGYVTPDANTYYFVSRLEADGGFSLYSYGAENLEPDGAPLTQAIFETHPDQSSTFGANPLRIAMEDNATVDNPVISFDELSLYVSTTSTNDSSPHIQVATRSTTSDAFGALVALHELDSPEGEYPTWISPDRCRLYLTRTVNAQTDLFVASRSK